MLIADENVNWNQWPLGRVVNVYPGLDKGTTLKRTVTKLCLLEEVYKEEEQ